MAGVICYIERAVHGGDIRSVRLVGPGVDRTWFAPERTGDDAPLVGESIPDIARWIRDQLDGVKAIDALCIDTSGSRCQWIEAPSTDATVVSAAVQHRTGPDDPEVVLSSMGGASLQALAPAKKRGMTLLPAPRGDAPSNGTSHRRFAVLSVPDATARLLIDELDTLRIKILRVMSIWHLLAGTWDRHAEGAAGVGAGRQYDFDGTIDAEAEVPVCASVIVEPEGDRLLWSWSQSGRLLAAGAMRLRPIEQRGHHETTETHDIATDDDATRRFVATNTPPERILAFTKADAGRLAVEWMSWAAQLGLNPDRIVGLTPPLAADEDPDAPATLAEAMSRAWPGALVDVGEDGDPVGATMRRFVDRPSTFAATAQDQLVELTDRPGRVDRRAHQWIAIAIVVLAALVGVLGWQLRGSVPAVNDQAAAIKEEQRQKLAAFADKYDDLETRQLTTAPSSSLRGKLERMKQLAAQAEAERPKPVFKEFVRVLRVFEPVAEDVQLREMTFNSFACDLRFAFNESEISATLSRRFRETPGEVTWTLSEPGGRPSGRDREFRYHYSGFGQWKLAEGRTAQ